MSWGEVSCSRADGRVDLYFSAKEPFVCHISSKQLVVWGPVMLLAHACAELTVTSNNNSNSNSNRTTLQQYITGVRPTPDPLRR